MQREGKVMLELSEDGRRIVDALIGARIAWQSPAELASALDRDLEETTDLLAILDADGWLASWDREVDVVVTLSVGAASRLGVRLVEFGQDEAPRWARSDEPEPPRPRASGVFRGERAASLELVVDPSIAPEEVAERAEEALSRSAVPTDPRKRPPIEGLPMPTLLIGAGLSPWPGPGDGRKASCPSCGSKHLQPWMYCLYCDRWGLDHMLRDEPAPRPRSTRDPKDDARRRELERQARKSKRRTRRFAQAEAERQSKQRPRRTAS
jgi:hypothetical protein